MQTMTLPSRATEAALRKALGLPPPQPACRYCGLLIRRVARGKVWAHVDTLTVLIQRARLLGCSASHNPEPEAEALDPGEEEALEHFAAERTPG